MTSMPGREPHPTCRETSAGPRIRILSYPTCFPSTVGPQEGGLFPPCSPHVADSANNTCFSDGPICPIGRRQSSEECASTCDTHHGDNLTAVSGDRKKGDTGAGALAYS